MSRSDSEHGSLVMNHNTDVDLFDGITEDDLPADDVGWGTTISAAWTQADAGQYREFVSILLEQVRKLTDQLDRARETIRFQRDERGSKRWTPSAGQLIDVAKWNLLRYIPVKMRGAEDDKEETAKPFASL